MNRGLARVGAIVVSIILVLSLIMIPSTADATVVELTQQDFRDAINTPRTKTAKGILYEKDGERECFYLDSGEYKFAEDIDLGVACIECRGEYVFDFNGKKISNLGSTALLFFYDSNAKVIGNGTITCEGAGIAAMDSNVVVEDMTLNSPLTFASENREVNLVINNSKIMNNTYIRGIKAIATINSGEFYGGEYGNNSCTVTDQATLIINDGLFVSDKCALEANNKGELDLPAGLIIINGGTFKSSGTDSDCYGTLAFISADNVVLNGGTFIYEGSTFGPISTVYDRGKDVKEVFNSFLGEGCNYSEALEFVEDSYENITMSWIKQKSISVVKKNTDSKDSGLSPTNQSSNDSSQNTSKVKVPKTDDDIIFWISIFAFAAVVLSVTVIVERLNKRKK